MTLLDQLRGISEPVIVTHDRKIHADELLAIAVIKTALPDRPIHINRSRDPIAWEKADLLIDVGGRNNPFDHHYSGAPVHSNGMPYASCGLVLDAIEPDAKLRNQLYCDLFYAVEWDDNTPPGEIVSPNWNLKPNLLAWVPFFQPLKEECPSEYELRACFDKALEMVTAIYQSVRRNAIAKIKNRELADRTTYVVQNGILWLDNPKTPFYRYVNEHPEVLAVVIPEEKRGYTVKIIRTAPKEPTLRANFPAVWAGHFDYELEQIARIRGLTYCSNSGDRITCSDRKAVEQALKYLES